jgi:ferredoxin/flavodoxin---NADP+ reductase
LFIENQILKKESLANDIISLDIYAPVIAKKALAGQFVVVRSENTGERVPLTIANSDASSGVINLTILKRGKTTNMLSLMDEGDLIKDIAGPLGKPSEIEKFGRVMVIGGGVGIAPTIPIIKALKLAGNHVITVLGAKNENGIIFESHAKKFSDEIYFCTDDGSRGFKGFVSEFLSDYVKSNGGSPIDRVVAIGPALMMKVVCDITKILGIKTIVSLNPIMVDGTGMCGSCRVEIGGTTMFACVDGPEFDGHLVDFKLLISRLNIYCEEENTALKNFMERHKCKMNN